MGPVRLWLKKNGAHSPISSSNMVFLLEPSKSKTEYMEENVKKEQESSSYKECHLC
jgi:hypothetical protein